MKPSQVADQTPTEETRDSKKELIIGITIVALSIAAIAGIAFWIYSLTPRIVYQPADACELLTNKEASELLGKNTLRSKHTEPTQSKNTATSQCGYTDGKPEMNDMVVAAVVVRSGINDAGVQQNKTEFVAGKPGSATPVKDLGDNAYYNQNIGQLNVLNGRDWLILSYGVGSMPETNTLEKAVTLARKVLN